MAKAKASYAQTLRNLEKISDEIHHRRRRRERRRAKASASAEKKGPVIYHPLMNSSPEEDSGNDQTTSGDEGAHSLSVDSVTDATPSSSSIAQTSDVQCDSNKENWCKPRNSVLESSDSKPLNSQLPNADRSRLVPNGNGKNERNVQSVKSPAKVPCSTSTNESLILSPDADTEQIRMNAAVMAAISRSKQQRVISSPFLRPNSSRDDFLVDGSETDSVSGSFVSGSVCNLDDDQIESLMRDTDEYRRIVATMDATESDHFSRLSLPARLRHLRDYFNFEPTWDDDDDDDGDDVEISVAASDDRDLDTSGWDTSGIGSHNGGSTSSAYSAECSSSSASACAASVQSNAAEKDLNYACKAPVRVECSARHPLANVTEGSDSG